jgi:lysophospholipase L1-like esterase
MYGTNDWNRPECQDERFPCFTIDSLSRMVGIVRSLKSLPVLSTIIPANPLFTDRAAAARNDWVARMNEEIRALAAAQDVALADPHAHFVVAPNLGALFSDHIHPNDDGYDLIATAFLEAITSPRSATTD